MPRKKRLTPVNPYALAKIIQKRELKRYWVAMQIGVEKSTMKRWISGHTRSMNIDTFNRLQELLEFDVTEWKESDSKSRLH